MDGVFSLHGVVLDEGGAPLPGLVLAVADADLFMDDLLAVGITGPDGSFRVSFTREAFNQEPLEREQTPDVYLIISRHEGSQLRALHRASFPGLRFAGPEDLGAIRVPSAAPPPDLDPLPGYRKRARRVRVDGETVAHALAEVAPIVESLTGWRGLLDGIEVTPVRGLGNAVGGFMNAAAPRDEAWIERTLTRWVLDLLTSASGTLALYDPFARTIFVDRAKAERQSLDGLKVVLGHELVHVGQFLNHPELARAYAEATVRLLRGIDEDAAAGAPAGGGAAQEAHFIGPRTQAVMAELFGLMANIEGYASYIENDFLRSIYQCATLLPNASLIDLLVQRMLRPGTAASGPLAGVGATFQDSVQDKMNQYDVGRQAYRDRQADDQPVRFDPTLRLGSSSG